MSEQYTRKIKTITGDGTTSLTITPTPGKRVFSVQAQLTYSGGTNTLAALMTALTRILVKAGSVSKWNLTGTQLRDFMLLHGTTYDFNGLPNTGAQITIPLAPEWFLANVADQLAWNPALLGGPISIEITSSTALSCVAYETISDDLDAPSSGILTLEAITTVAGGTKFYTGEEFDIRGRLVSASVYPDSGASNEITPCGLLLGSNDRYAHEALTSAQNDEQLERKSLTPAASGRTANIYDIVAVKDDMLSRSWNLDAAKSARIEIQAGSAMSGTVTTVLARLEPK